MQLNVEVELQDLAELIFIKNVNNARIYIDLSCFTTTKELFFFLVHLLCKGLVVMYGTNNRIEIDDVSFEQYSHISNKLRCIGVNCILAQEQVTNTKLSCTTFCNTHCQNLKDMYVSILSQTNQYKISFQLIHEHNL